MNTIENAAQAGAEALLKVVDQSAPN